MGMGLGQLEYTLSYVADVARRFHRFISIGESSEINYSMIFLSVPHHLCIGQMESLREEMRVREVTRPAVDFHV
jgi:hypothetical protein